MDSEVSSEGMGTVHPEYVFGRFSLLGASVANRIKTSDGRVDWGLAARRLDVPISAVPAFSTVDG